MKAAISSALALTALQAVDAAAIPDVSGTLQNILQNTHNSDLYTYPTDLTRGIIPVRIDFVTSFCSCFGC